MRSQRAKSGVLNLDKSQQFSRAVVDALKRVRQKKGISQERLAKACGLSRSAVSMIESGDRNPTLFVCHALAVGLGIRLSKVVRDAERNGQSSR
jgi:transcriptional regulator with XRE-family HTH domain